MDEKHGKDDDGGYLSASNLSEYRIKNMPPSMYYIPSFISAPEEAHILSFLAPHRWTYLSKRRLQAHPSALSASGTLLKSSLPPYLSSPILDRFTRLGIFATSPHQTANHCLVNEYEPGQGIMAHEDGGSYFSCTATVSLGGAVVLDVWSKSDPTQRWRIYQEPCSLLITTGEIYASTLHGIAETDVDEDLSPDTVANWALLGDSGTIMDRRNPRTTRTSLTYRDVLKVSDAGRKILGFGRR